MAASLNTNALTTVAEARAVLGLPKSESNDELSTRLINSASDFFENRCSRKFLLAAVTEEVGGFGEAKLIVSRTPVQTVTEIRYDGDPLDLTRIEIEAESGLILLPGGFRWTAHLADDITGTPRPGSERRLYAVDYEGGYITPLNDANAAAPFDGNARNLPYDLEEAVLTYIRSRFHQRRRDPNIKTEKLRTWSATYGGMTVGGGVNSSLPGEVQDALALYTRLC